MSANKIKPISNKACTVISVAAAILGQVSLKRKGYPLDGPIFYGIALSCFLYTILKERKATNRIGRTLHGEGSPPVKPIWLLASFIAAAVAFSKLGGNKFTKTGLIFWIVSILAFIFSSARFSKPNLKSFETGIRLRKETWILLSILSVGAFFRFYHLSLIPPEMTSDHAEKLLDVWDVLHGKYSIYFTRNTGREPFQFYWTALLIRLIPLSPSHLALKLGTSMVSWLTLIYTYLLAKELFDEETGLMATGALAVSRWHIAISRIGLRFPLTAFFLAPMLYHLSKALHTNHRNQWILAGFWLGAGLHGYTAFRIVPLLFFLLIFCDAALEIARFVLTKRHNSTVGRPTEMTPGFWVNASIATATASLVFLPLLRFWHDDPGMFWYRSGSRVIAHQPATKLMHIFLNNVKNALLMFNYRGDVVWANTVPGSPVLGYVTGGLFVLGFSYILWTALARLEKPSIFVLVTFLIMLLPSILSLAFPNENPSVVRTGGAVIPVAIIIAIPAVYLHRALKGLVPEPWGRPTAYATLLALWLLAISGSYHWYFDTYYQEYRLNSWNNTELAEVLGGFAKSVSDMEHVYIKAFPYWVDTRIVGIDMGDVKWNNVLMDIHEADSQVKDPTPKMYLLYPKDEKSLQYLQKLYPQGHKRIFHSKIPGKDFIVFWVK